ncbi:FadR/GntR family transcriptional regulator [Desulfovibrio inopinatus]|uniref:FadR/GntR family transcriptional regulator n=1 Tax=Desulfovibrio inopinatus TaxID=102109 RepID=UPI00040AA731|nr:GntR family transcriptional regulator [Desulfovibrio inopinatus]
MAKILEMSDQETLFVPVTGGRASEEVILQIEAAILDGKIKPGESLPSERDLQHRFETSRGVVREALRALKEKGLLEIRKGAKGGAFVKNIDVVTISQSLALFLKQRNISPNCIIEFRESHDRIITTMAITKGTDEEKAELIALASRLEDVLTQDTPDLASASEMDRDLNILLAKMTKNPIFEWVMQAMQLGFTSLDDLLYADPEFRAATAGNWTDTAKAIAEGDPLKALSFTGFHYVMLRRCIASVQQKQSMNL